ncbi:MAG: alpha/beta hydrolase [Dermatophilaceae bacterium]
MITYLNRPEGRIAYDRTGQGPLIVLVPGMGDLRSTYRFLVPDLAAAGFTVVSVDLRGHGDSDTGFASYGDAETAEDLAALLDELGQTAVVVGNSMGAGAGAYLAAVRPELVRGLVLVGPFVRNGKLSAFQRILMRVALARPWIATTWRHYVPSLYAGRRPEDFSDHLDAVVASLKRPGYAAAFAALARSLDHDVVEQRLGQVRTPTQIVMGALDPDFPDPEAEARWIAGTLNGEVLMVSEAGHYPHAQRPDLVGPAVVDFVTRVHGGA